MVFSYRVFKTQMIQIIQFFFKIHFRIAYFCLKGYMRRNISELYVTGIYSFLSVKSYYTEYICKYQPGSFIYKYTYFTNEK